MEQSFLLEQLLGPGRSCSPCRERLKDGVEQIPAVTSIAINEASLVVFAAHELAEDVQSLARKLRYEFTHAEWSVAGMDCGGCKKTIENALGKKTGVTASHVHFMQQKLNVEFKPNAISKEEIADTVTKLGFQLQLLDGHDSQDSSQIEESNKVQHSPKPATEKWWQTRKAKYLFLTVVLLSTAYVLPFVGLGNSNWAFAVVTLVAGFPIAKKAFQAARNGTPFSIEMLMSIASIGALFIGAAEEAAMVVLLFEVGEFLEYIATSKARSSIQSLLSLSPPKAFLVESKGITEVEASILRVGQNVEVRAGGRVPTDGIVTHGASSVDESHLTGESIPVSKVIGDKVFAGSILHGGLLRFSVEKTTQDNSLARIVHLVEQAESSKSPSARFVERFSRYYTPLVIVFAVCVALIPPLFFLGEWPLWTYRGLALLLIGCPCALVISVPASITAAISNGARRGLLIKGGAALEAIGKVKTIAFDKTGTLTVGKPSVVDVISVKGSVEETVAYAASVEAGSSHPLAMAISNYATENGVKLFETDAHTTLPGKAVGAVVKGQKIFVASPQFAASLVPISQIELDKVTRKEALGQTVVAVVNETTKTLVGFISLRDEPREESNRAIAELTKLGVNAVMLTGDNVRTAEAIGKELGISVRGGMLPEDKLKSIGELRSDGPVAMAGDGINDAPAMAAADVGIAMGAGTDVALETADAVLSKNSIADVVTLIKLSRSALSVVKQNVAFALGLKTIFLVTTVAGITGLWIAVLSDTGATVIVTLNALRLLNKKWTAE